MPLSQLRFALIGGALLAASCAWGADTDSQAFLKQAIEGNTSDIAIGKLAQEKGTTPGVKSFAQTLVADRTKANQQAQEAAKELKVSIGAAVATGTANLHDRLANEPSSKQFDKDLVNDMLQDSQREVDSYQAASALPGAAGQYAKTTLPVLQKQLGTLQQLAHELGI